ncbi:hypothetical protein MATL_G00108360 [Megalops atlanticus]|uniref:PHD-type domain-containing protein n=1 Tax=Megalops atlanticus TaxID=7932 RepID=A0A9D3TCC3_MEGAT|nr:hypothetical protein MATL_G00108360 [Megalops atlanticus]
MVDHMSSGLAPSPGSGQNQDPMDISAQVSTVCEKGEHYKIDAEKSEESGKYVKTTSKEFKKTWGFRRTTIAQRQVPADIDRQNSRNVHRSAQQAKPRGKLEGCLSTAKCGQGGRRSTPAFLESSKPPSQTPTDAGTASEASFDGYIEAKTTEVSAGTKSPIERKTCRMEMTRSGNVSDDEDSDEITLKELQKRLKKKNLLMERNREVHSVDKKDEDRSLCKPTAIELSDRQPSGSPVTGTTKNSMCTCSPRTRVGRFPFTDSNEEEGTGEEESRVKSDSDGYDPNALYCVCRQKHNNRNSFGVCPPPSSVLSVCRFMICCDHCDEWFHGDCVGVSEARGRLLEKNREEYICPKCTMQKSCPATSSSSEDDKQATSVTEETSSPSQTVPPSGAEETSSEGQGIKGRIERATNPSGKHKLKIFQPVLEASSLSKCIGPGCDKIALPDSVYCGNDCILKHASATMKLLTNMKEPVSREKLSVLAWKRPVAEPSPKVHKRYPRERKTGKELAGPCSRVEEEESDSEGEAVMEQEPDAKAWSSDHNYNAVKPENSTAIPSSVFYKSSVQILGLTAGKNIMLY